MEAMEESYRVDLLQKLEPQCELLVYDWSTGGDMELVVEDIQKIGTNLISISEEIISLRTDCSEKIRKGSENGSEKVQRSFGNGSEKFRKWFGEVSEKVRIWFKDLEFEMFFL